MSSNHRRQGSFHKKKKGSATVNASAVFRVMHRNIQTPQIHVTRVDSTAAWNFPLTIGPCFQHQQSTPTTVYSDLPATHGVVFFDRFLRQKRQRSRCVCGSPRTSVFSITTLTPLDAKMLGFGVDPPNFQPNSVAVCDQSVHGHPSITDAFHIVFHANTRCSLTFLIGDRTHRQPAESVCVALTGEHLWDGA